MKQDLFSLKGKVCVVTGGYQGIGEVVAGAIAEAGADIAIFDLQDASHVADNIAKEHNVFAYVCDVSSPELQECIDKQLMILEH